MAPQDPKTHVDGGSDGGGGPAGPEPMHDKAGPGRRDDHADDDAADVVKAAYEALHRKDPSLFEGEPFAVLFRAAVVLGFDDVAAADNSAPSSSTPAGGVAVGRHPLLMPASSSSAAAWCVQFVLASMRAALEGADDVGRPDVHVLQRGMTILAATVASRRPETVPALLRRVEDANKGRGPIVSVAVLPDVMVALPGETRLQRTALQAAADITALPSPPAKLHRRMVQAGLADGLRAAATNRGIVEDVSSALNILKVLSNLSPSAGHSKSVLEALEGCLPLVVDLMHDYDLYETMQEHGCRVLRHVSEFCPKSVSDAGGLGAAVRALKLHGHHRHVQEHGNVVLLRLVPARSSPHPAPPPPRPAASDYGDGPPGDDRNFPLCLALVLNALGATAATHNDGTGDDADFLLLRGMKILLDMTAHPSFASSPEVLALLLRSPSSQRQDDCGRTAYGGTPPPGDAPAVSFLLDVLMDFPHNSDLVVHTVRVVAQVAAVPSPELRRRLVLDGLTDALASAADCHPGSVPVAVHVMGTLSHLSFEAAGSDTVLTALEESIPLIVALMRRHESVADVRELGCCTLNNLSLLIPEAVADAGGTSAVVNALKMSGNDAATRVLAGAALLRLIPVLCKDLGDDSTDAAMRGRTMALIALVAAQVGPQINDRLVRGDAKVAASIVAVVSAHPHNESLTSNGLKALAFFSNDASAELIEAMRNCVEPVFAALQCHASNVEIQSSCLQVLRNLSPGHDGWIVPTDAVGAFLSTMRTHRMNSEIQEQGCTTLANLLRSDMGSHAIVRAVTAENFIPTLFEIAEAHRAHVGIQQHVFEVLYLLSCIKSLTTQSTKRFVTDQNIAEILEQMKQPHCFGSPELCTFACGLLTNLSGKPSNREAIASTGGIGLILATLRRYTTVAEIQAHGCSILRNLALDDKIQEEIIAFEGIGTIMMAMMIYPDDARIQERGCDALARLATGNRAAQRVIVEDENGIAIATDALARHPDHAGVQKSGAFLLECISEYYPKGAKTKGLLGGGRASLRIKHFVNNLSA